MGGVDLTGIYMHWAFKDSEVSFCSSRKSVLIAETATFQMTNEIF